MAHNQLAIIYAEADDLDRALRPYRESIRLKETQGDIYRAARTRFNVALALMQAARFSDARQYAKAAPLTGHSRNVHSKTGYSPPPTSDRNCAIVGF